MVCSHLAHLLADAILVTVILMPLTDSLSGHACDMGFWFLVDLQPDFTYKGRFSSQSRVWGSGGPNSRADLLIPFRGLGGGRASGGTAQALESPPWFKPSSATSCCVTLDKYLKALCASVSSPEEHTGVREENSDLYCPHQLVLRPLYFFPHLKSLRDSSLHIFPIISLG